MLIDNQLIQSDDVGRHWNFQVPANFQGRRAFYFSVARHGRNRVRFRVEVDGMAAAFPLEYAAVLVQVAKQVASLH